MTDAEIRDLDRRFKESGSVDDGVAYLLAKVRANGDPIDTIDNHIEECDWSSFAAIEKAGHGTYLVDRPEGWLEEARRRRRPIADDVPVIFQARIIRGEKWKKIDERPEYNVYYSVAMAETIRGDYARGKKFARLAMFKTDLVHYHEEAAFNRAYGEALRLVELAQYDSECIKINKDCNVTIRGRSANPESEEHRFIYPALQLSSIFTNAICNSDLELVRLLIINSGMDLNSLLRSAENSLARYDPTKAVQLFGEDKLSQFNEIYEGNLGDSSRINKRIHYLMKEGKIQMAEKWVGDHCHATSKAEGYALLAREFYRQLHLAKKSA